MGDFVIQTENVVKRFGKTFALNGLNMQVPKGISGFIGKNGAGKTTTISIFLGLLKPSGGVATVFGLDCWQDSFQIRRRLGIMHEINAYPSGFSGRRFLEYAAKIYGITRVTPQVTDALKAVGLTHAKDKPIKTYSAGMLKRLGLAQALIGNPELVILDEPTANVDPFGRIDLLEKIKVLNKEQGTSFLISTHILGDLEKICNWLSIIDAGKIVDQGYVKDLATKYSADVYKIEVSNPRLFVETVQNLNAIEKVWIADGKVYCKVKDSDAFCGSIPQIVAELKLQLNGVQLMVGTIEEIYTKTAGGC